MIRPITALAAVSLVVLGACTPGAGGPTRSMPDYFYSALLSSELARTVARECGGALAYDDAEWNRRLPQIERQLLADGYDTADLQQILTEVPVDRIRTDTEAYVADNGLVAGQAQGFCEAGRSEIADDTEIGTFLRTAS